MSGDVTVVIPTHPQRMKNGYLDRALKSVWGQDHVPDSIIVSTDRKGEGAAPTRHRGLMQVSTEWVAFLDSDDEFLPFHLSSVLKCAEDSGADYVYSWFQTWGGVDPFPQFYKQPWDNANPHHTTITTLVKTELAQSVGFLNYLPDAPNSHEDWLFTEGCIAAGAKIVHHPEKTWIYHHHGNNTSGQPTKGDAR